MDLPRPRTYKELMLYRRCREFQEFAGPMDDDLFAKLYNFLQESDDHKVVAKNGQLLFEDGGEEVDSCPFTVAGVFSLLEITATDIHMDVPSSHRYSSDSGGVSGNNNNNNNNNNNS